MNDNFILFLLIFILILHFKDRTKDIYLINKTYNKKFKFNKFYFKYYNLLSILYINPRSDIKTLSIFKRFFIKSNDVFLDIGSGDGFNLLYMNKFHNFKKVIGVELDKTVYNISLYNIKLSKSNKIKVINNDILNYQIPTYVTYIYLFNPFAKVYYKRKISNEELNQYKMLVKNIKHSYSLKNRKITIVFSNITPVNDSSKNILQLFKNNFDKICIHKINYQFFESSNVGIFQLI